MHLIFTIIAVILLLLPFFAFFTNVRAKRIFYEAGYQIYYYILGGRAMFEDYVYRRWNKIEIVSKAGQVAVITGGARGLGVEVVKGLLKCEMHIVIGCRNVEAGKKVIETVRKSGTTSGSAKCLPLDLTSMKSVQSFGETVYSEYPKIHMLINNAGVMFVPYKLTEDGYESHFAVNYLGHCVLTHLLLPRLKAGGEELGTNSRIVNVSSCAYLAGSIHFKDITMKDMYIPSAAYAQSKLAQVLFTNKLETLLRSDNVPIQAHSVHPGIVNTDLFNGTFLKSVAPWVPYIFFKTPKQGAASVLYACNSLKLEGRGGTYITNCQITSTNSAAKSEKIQNKLWEVMMSMIKVDKFGETM